ncbi:phosphoribosylglycinamide formyltransferase [Actinospica robiniae]|uniref:phosphoribosylglycinamide formyltransferase n=1 Tax=Actinospica robiniae TaxID=304901 RepID=UPI00040EAD40|nr:phosphoribosylglycinamide formyltransferase [Actinospica robiniae]
MAFNVAVLASHFGTNLQALITAARESSSGFGVALVISNNSGSGALAHARDAGIAALHMSGQTHPDTDALDQHMLTALRRHDIELLVTAGYMKKLGPAVLSAYKGRAINIHPSLLPRHGGPGMYGRFVHEAVLASGDTVSGATVHEVTADYDEGPIIAQRQVPVLPEDNPEDLAARVLPVEHALLAATVRVLARASVSG